MGTRAIFFEVKRQFERIHFEDPIAGFLDDQPVRVLDLAVGGARVLGSVKVTPGSAHDLRIDWEKKSIRMKCEVKRCIMLSPSQYEVGLRIVESLGDSDRVMRSLVASYVMRALEEQKANWEGIPPIGPYIHLEGKSGRYRRCEFLDGDWKVSATTRPEQPINGFTISAEVSPRYLEMLCKTYEKMDDEGRRLTRILAELSINKAEGVPTRRYIP